MSTATNRIDRYDGYHEFCSHLRAGPEGIVLFRGQNRQFRINEDISLLPSAYRPGSKTVRIRDVTLNYLWRIKLERELYDTSPTGIAKRLRYATCGGWAEQTPGSLQGRISCSQQYSCWSAGLDLTSNREVALWFALHDAIQSPSGYDFSATSSPEPCVYVFECLKPEVGRLPPTPRARASGFLPDVYCLQRIFADDDCRAVRQSAHIYCPPENLEPDPNSCLDRLTHRLVFSKQGISDCLSKMEMSEDQLFPSPRVDRYYRWLLFDNTPSEIFTLASHWADFNSGMRELVLDEIQKAERFQKRLNWFHSGGAETILSDAFTNGRQIPPDILRKLNIADDEPD